MKHAYYASTVHTQSTLHQLVDFHLPRHPPSKAIGAWRVLVFGVLIVLWLAAHTGVVLEVDTRRDTICAGLQSRTHHSILCQTRLHQSSHLRARESAHLEGAGLPGEEEQRNTAACLHPAAVQPRTGHPPPRRTPLCTAKHPAPMSRSPQSRSSDPRPPRRSSLPTTTTSITPRQRPSPSLCSRSSLSMLMGL